VCDKLQAELFTKTLRNNKLFIEMSHIFEFLRYTNVLLVGFVISSLIKELGVLADVVQFAEVQGITILY